MGDAGPFSQRHGKSGELADTRKRQAVDWMWSLLMEDLKTLFLNHKEVRGLFPRCRRLWRKESQLRLPLQDVFWMFSGDRLLDGNRVSLCFTVVFQK